MKISVDGKELFELSEVRKKVISNDINSDLLDGDLKRRMQYSITHKYEKCMERLKSEWILRLKESGVRSIPLDDDELADLIFRHPEYKDRKQRDLEV